MRASDVRYRPSAYAVRRGSAAPDFTSLARSWWIMQIDPASLASAGHVSMIWPFAANASVVADETLFSTASLSKLSGNGQRTEGLTGTLVANRIPYLNEKLTNPAIGVTT